MNYFATWDRYDLFKAKYAELFNTREPSSVLLFGTSHVVHGVNPALLERPGFRPYNFAFNSSNPTFFIKLYQDIRTYYGVPRVILFGLDPLFLKRFVWSHDYEQDSEYWPLSLFLSRLFAFDDHFGMIAQNRLPLIKNREALQNALTGVKPTTVPLMNLAYRGFVPLQPHPNLSLEGTDFPDDPRFAGDLPVLLKTLKADGVRIVVFQTPEYLASTGDHRLDNAKLARVLERFDLPFLNYNGSLRSAINTTPAFFNDGGHLNVLGAEAFSQRLGRDLRALPGL